MVTQQSVIEIWQVVDCFLQEKLGRVSYSTFQKAVKPISFFNNTLILGVPNNFMKKWVLDKSEYYIKKAVKDYSDMDIILEININDLIRTEIDRDINIADTADELEVQAQPAVSYQIKEKAYVPQTTKNPLNPKYTFDNFVVGQCNRFPHAAAVAVSKAPGKAYNPLFVYGGVGLGKTHLMHAIGNKVLETYPQLNVLYTTAEDFTNDLIHSLQNNKIMNFRERYRSVDVLLIDDIPFIAGKEKTEEEFFHTFNNLHQMNKQIVITSDRLPKDIPSIEDRLRSRFEWGLSADIQSPELETRIAILYKKIEPDIQVVPKDVIYYIASQIPENVRELEGALIKIIAYASLVNQQITINLAKDVIKDIVKDKAKKPISLSKIKKTVSEYYDIDIEYLSAKIRTKEIAHARQVAMFLARDLTNYSLPKIGESFGNRDHTTVMHACDKINNEIKKNHDLKSALNQIKLILVE
ncbi:MAG: chromosomal replication initiator protein DnaA [Candidatus Margulisbacteria bacterium]|nr:chromosomal replication initiator protein DnaA [Candidatus Margulisiibacteriota bacterium]